MMGESSPDRICISVDGRTAEVPRSATVLEAARQAGIQIPTLCHARGLSPYGACRVCVVEVESPRGARVVASCSYPAEEGLVVRTDTELVRNSRRAVLELLLAQAPQSAELSAFAAGLGVESTPLERTETGKCILCGLCVRVCNDLMARGAIGLFGRGAQRKVRTAYGEPTDQCQACGACAFVCPTGAVDLGSLIELLRDALEAGQKDQHAGADTPEAHDDEGGHGPG
jgi:NADH dehydrogenase/NADH:ubiquinone oxidoreductase subunit G